MVTPGMVAPVEWAGDKRYLWIFGVLTITLPIVAAVSALATNWYPLWWARPFIVFTTIPLSDSLIGDDPDNPFEDVVPTLEEQRCYRRITYLMTTVLYVNSAVSIWVLHTNDLVWYNYTAFAFSVGVVTGISISTAYELSHKTDGFERWLVEIMSMPMAYGHFSAEHNRGHHIQVATLTDPASARYGESPWESLPRAVVGSVKSVRVLEKYRLEQQDHPIWPWYDDVLNAWAMAVILWGMCVTFVGLEAVPFLIIRVVYGASLLEIVNYLEYHNLYHQQPPSNHYG